MKRIAFLLLLFFCFTAGSFSIQAQPYTVVDKQATLTTGGEAKLNKLIKQWEKEYASINGAAIVYILIQQDGTIGDIKVGDATSHAAASSAYSFAVQLPSFSAGILNGTAVPSWRKIILVMGKYVWENSEEHSKAIERQKATIDKLNSESFNKDRAVAIIDDTNPYDKNTQNSLPNFPGGKREVNKFIADHLRYPEDCAKAGITGRVILEFVVQKDGSISNIKSVRDAHPSLVQESIRVIQLMPRWFPGIYKGEKARVKYTLPITFKL